MKRCSLNLALALCVVFGPGIASANLVRYRTVFEEESRKIEAGYVADEKKAGEDYVRYLQSVITHMEKKEDDFGLRPAKAELARFKAEKTIPEKAELGTPELIDKGQRYYRDALERARARRNEAMNTLAARYTQRLQTLGNSGEGGAVADEIRRVARWLDGDTGFPDGADGAVEAGGSLPGMPGGLLAAFVPDARQSEVPNRVRRGAPAVVQRAQWTSLGDGVCLRFDHEMAMLKVPELRLRAGWTLAANVSFRRVRDEQPRVLVSHGFRRHHVMVDEVGELGVYDGDFQGSGYNVTDLRGWHCLGVVVSGGRTMFYVDGKAVGVARAACTRPVNVIGNRATGRQQWGGSVSSVYLWPRALSLKEMAEACERMGGE